MHCTSNSTFCVFKTNEIPCLVIEHVSCILKLLKKIWVSLPILLWGIAQYVKP